MKGGYELFRYKHKDPFTGEECHNDRDFELLTEDETGNLAMACEDCELLIGLWVRIADDQTYEWGMRNPLQMYYLLRGIQAGSAVVVVAFFIIFLISVLS